MGSLSFCVSGVRGGDLEERIESIIAGGRHAELTRIRRAALFFGAAAFINAPVVVGALSARPQAARNLSPSAGRQVIDRTGLKGAFDLDLKWAADPLSPDAEDVSLFAAIQERLGLTLEPTRAPLDVLVVEGAERPGEN
jgi:hypothetical protein